MTPDTAKAAMQFMSRIQLQPAEIPAYNQVMTELHMIAEPITQAEGQLMDAAELPPAA
jgi:hypothetical protein